MNANGRKDVQPANGAPSWVSLLIVAALITLLGMSGSANAADADQRQDSEQRQQGANGIPITGAEATGTQMQMNDIARASALIGKNVTDAGNKDIGEIKDMAVDMQNSRIGYVVVGMGGILGIGEKLVAVPPQAFTLTRTDDEFTVKLSAAQDLQRATRLKDDNWISALDANAISDLYRQSGVTAPADLQAGNGYRKATEILGRNVLTNHDVGGFEVEDIAVDLSDGRAPYIVLSAGGFGGIATKLVAVPTPAVSPGPEDYLRVRAAGEQLMSAPALDEERWETTLADPEWGADLYLSYDLTPYWTKGSAPRAVGGTQAPASETLEGQGNQGN